MPSRQGRHPPYAKHLEKGYSLDAGDLEALATADVLARQLIVLADHVALPLGKPGPVALIGAAGHLGLLTAHQPADLVLVRLAAMRAGESMGLLLRLFVVKITFFHALLLLAFPQKYSILGAGFHEAQFAAAGLMAKKKSKPFSVTTAVKRNARDQVGQPRPEKVIVSEPKESRRTRKHKPSLSKIMQEEQ